MDLLGKKDSWAPSNCGRVDCFLCTSTNKKSGTPASCMVESVCYLISCDNCQSAGVTAHYCGESARTGYIRGREHLKGHNKKSEDNALAKHDSVHHGGIKSSYSMKILRKHEKTLSRQIHEATVIDNSLANIVMNSKSEILGQKVPRVTVEMGAKQYTTEYNGTPLLTTTTLPTNPTTHPKPTSQPKTTTTHPPPLWATHPNPTQTTNHQCKSQSLHRSQSQTTSQPLLSPLLKHNLILLAPPGKKQSLGPHPLQGGWTGCRAPWRTGQGQQLQSQPPKSHSSPQWHNTTTHPNQEITDLEEMINDMETCENEVRTSRRGQCPTAGMGPTTKRPLHEHQAFQVPQPAPINHNNMITTTTPEPQSPKVDPGQTNNLQKRRRLLRDDQETRDTG